MFRTAAQVYCATLQSCTPKRPTQWQTVRTREPDWFSSSLLVLISIAAFATFARSARLSRFAFGGRMRNRGSCMGRFVLLLMLLLFKRRQRGFVMRIVRVIWFLFMSLQE